MKNILRLYDFHTKIDDNHTYGQVLGTNADNALYAIGKDYPEYDPYYELDSYFDRPIFRPDGVCRYFYSPNNDDFDTPEYNELYTEWMDYEYGAIPYTAPKIDETSRLYTFYYDADHWTGRMSSIIAHTYEEAYKKACEVWHGNVINEYEFEDCTAEYNGHLISKNLVVMHYLD